ncbi:MAG: phage late control D family protein [Gammaproteobacteria bacterium]
MLTPAYKLTLGRKLIDTTDEPQASTVVDLAVTLDLDTPADEVRLVLGNVGRFRPALEDDAKIELGYADNGGLTQVMRGAVVRVEPNLTTIRILGYSAADKLLRTFVDATYESKTAGEIARDLAGKAEVDVQTADDGIAFPAYVIDGRRSVYRHMRDLAELCGFDVYIDADGKLVFEQFAGGNTVHVFEFAKHIVELEAQRSNPLAGRVEAFGESPAGRNGDESWAWLTKDFGGSKGQAGSGKPLLLLEKPALRTRDGAGTAAQATMTAVRRRTLQGRLLSLGRPEVKLGDAIRLSGLADATLNANFQVRSVTHRITKLGGFTTTVGFRSL